MINNGHQYDTRKRDLIMRGTMRINDLIAPDTIINEKTFMVIGTRLIRTIVVTGYPRTVSIGWLNRLYSHDANIDISIHIEPFPTTEVIKLLNKQIGRFMSTIRMDDQKGKVADIAIESALNDAEDLRDKLHNGISKFYYQGIYISIAAKDLDELDLLTEEVESLCGTLGLTTRIAVFQQDQGFMSVLPIADDRLRFRRNFDTDSLSTCFPLVSAELTDTTGNPILYGINQINNSLVMFDRFQLNNYNSVTLATSGAGKSYFVKLEAIRYLSLGTKIIIIDPQGEYERIAKMLGGEYINLSATSKDRINPLEINFHVEEEEDGRDFLTTKSLDILSIIEVMLGSTRELKAADKRELLQAIEEMYRGFGITRDNRFKKEEEEIIIDGDMFTIGNKKQTMPTLSDLNNALRAQGKTGVNIADDLEPYINGFMNLFNGETNVDINNDLIVFGIKDLERNLAELAMFICLEFIWNKVKSGDKKKRIVVVDEAWMMMKKESTAEFLVRVAKTARKFNAGLSIISQNVKDFYERGGEAIISNTSMQILLKQHPNEIKYVAEMFNLSESEQNLLRTAQRGEALIYAGENRTMVQVESNEYEHVLCTTSRIEAMSFCEPRSCIGRLSS